MDLLVENGMTRLMPSKNAQVSTVILKSIATADCVSFGTDCCYGVTIALQIESLCTNGAGEEFCEGDLVIAEACGFCVFADA